MNENAAGASLVDVSVGRPMTERTCWCSTCLPVTLDDMRMVACHVCGDKRCVHAKDHSAPCARHDIYAHNSWVEQHLLFKPPEDTNADVEELRRDLADNEALRDRMEDLLTRTANALRGAPPPLTLWSWHDLPARAAAAIAAIDVMQRAAAINGAAAVASDIDVERLIRECVPGGSICDPQQVADAIRRYFEARREDDRETPNVALSGACTA